MPSKGATMRMRASCALASATCASATSSAAALWSTALWLTKFCDTRSRLRCRLVRAMLACASACFSWACCSVSSSCTSNWPRRTRWPSAKPSDEMRPLTSGRSITPWRERSEPTAWASSSSVMASTLPTSTLTGPAGPAGPPGPAAPPGPAPGAAALGPAPASAAAGAALAGAGARFCHHHASPASTAMPSTATHVCTFFNCSPSRDAAL